MAGLLCVIGLNAILIISKPANANKASAFASLKNAGEMFRQAGVEAGRPVAEPEGTVAEIPSSVVNHIDLDRSDDENVVEAPIAASAVSPAGFMTYAIDQPAFLPAALLEPDMPLLNEDQKQQVKVALDASRKVMASSQWKMVEKEIADVFTQKEKEALKDLYSKQLENINWKEWETKLSYAYNSIEWEKVNLQLNQAVAEIRLDSIQLVYSKAIDKISDVERELKLNELESIPDSKYDLELLEEKKAELRKELNRVKAVRVKKTVRL